ncbi:BZ3500_MvSof-1268-A1-R1_Chr4-4g07537 [Microbotryum saponariae]|uniref:BZ3500_MvSof-1268-A1-R1_Chr4-4g07537 protein n=1 Tax=Microbotryum saponariae TaxID=289078 RepID=A0A2X0LCQ2_9BASI|nr:BZ3500_MvSof-1268-A1-R1_Chr4-4g07537 [Microbotryum saponariae]SDA07198.1 BZ3501_MvSof-1269-A2-R1_Chr4-3g07245 [Microbotryum saponariae]
MDELSDFHFSTFNDLLHSVFPPCWRMSRPASSTSLPAELPPPPVYVMRRSPGEKLPEHPLAFAVCDPTIIDRALSTLESGLVREGIARATTLPSASTSSVREYRNHILDPQQSRRGYGGDLSGILKLVVKPILQEFLGNSTLVVNSSLTDCIGQPAEEAWNVGVGKYNREGEWPVLESSVNLIVESTRVEALRPLYGRERIANTGEGARSPVGPDDWEPIDMRIVDAEGQDQTLEGVSAMMAQMSLHILSAAVGRFGLFYATPYFVLAELVVIDGQTFLLYGALDSFVLRPDDPVAVSRPFLAVLVALLLSCHPSFAVPGPSEAITQRIRDHARGRDYPHPRTLDGCGPLQDEADPVDRPASEHSEMDPGNASLPFLNGSVTSVSLRHIPKGSIICDAEGFAESRMLASPVELDCSDIKLFLSGDDDDWPGQAVPVPWNRTAPVPLELRLDLLQRIGHGRTSTVWSARWTPIGAAAAHATSPRSGATNAPEARLVAKVVLDKYAPSIAREYFVYTHIVPSLPLATQAFFPKFHGLYRSGPAGTAYIFVFDHAGEQLRKIEWEADAELKAETDAAFAQVASAGLYHGDERAANILRRPDGSLALIDWGEARLPSPNRYRPRRLRTVKATAPGGE